MTIYMGKPICYIRVLRNFTDNGLKHNHEYGVFLDNESLQKKLAEQIFGLPWMELSFQDVISLNKKAEEFMKEHSEAKQPVFKVFDYVSNRRKIMTGSCKFFVKPLGNADRPVKKGYRKSQQILKATVGIINL